MTEKQKAQKWKAMAIRLAKDLNRFSIEATFDYACEKVHHQPNEYHSFGEPCPVCEKIRKTIKDFDDLCLNTQENN